MVGRWQLCVGDAPQLGALAKLPVGESNAKQRRDDGENAEQRDKPQAAVSSAEHCSVRRQTNLGRELVEPELLRALEHSRLAAP